MKTFTFLISIFLLFGSFSTKAQTSTYTVSGPIKGQGPLLNTEPASSNDGSNGWAVIHPYNAYGGSSVNSWSSAQSIGFPFSFYGSSATHFCVSKNYLLTFDTTVAGTTVNSSITTDNTALPHADLPDSTIAYFWGGFSPPLGSNDAVQMKTFGTIPNRQLWIKNFSYKHEAQAYSYNFVVLEETTHKIYVVNGWWDRQGAGSYTVGVQLNSTIAVQHSSSPNISSINTSGGSNPWPNVDYYEFTPRFLVNDDAGILSLDAPVSSTAPGSQSVQVSIKNHGLNNLASVRVGWSIDGIAQTSHSWTGSLAPGAVAAAVNIGSYNFTMGNPTLKIWTSNPNGNPDNYTSNDTLEVSLFICNLLSGTYTLGRTSSDFPNFNSLATFLSNCGISGPVIIKVAPGTYREQFTLGNIAGVSQSNTIVIDGGDSSLARLTHDGSTSNATVAFDSTSYVSLRNITLENTKSSTDAWVVHLQNTDHIVIDSCLIEQPVNITFDRGGIVGSGSLTSASTITTNKHLTVSDNIITGGYYGIALEGNTSDEDVGNHILRNRFIDIHNYGILVDEQDSLIISGNVIENINSSFSYGIYCQDITDFEIRANNLLDCGDEGIVIYGGSSSGTARSLIANNMIYAPDAAIRMSSGFSSSFLSKINIYHNTAVGDPAMEFTGSNHSNMSLYNNIFSNPNGVALDASVSLPSTIDIDYNLYQYQLSGDIAEDDFTTTFTDLADWQRAKPALNAHSIEGDPIFVREMSPADLHVLDSLANDTGKSALGIRFDIDDDPRPLPPSTRVDMGADEYHPSTCLSSSNVFFSSIGSSTVTLNWTTGGASAWIIQWGFAGFSQGTGVSFSTINNPHILSNLISMTTYDFYIRDDCSSSGDGFSVWAGPFSFQTKCAPISAATLPIFEDFEFGFSDSIFQQNQDVLCASTYKWSYETSVPGEGRLRFEVKDFANKGNSAATLDRVVFGVEAINYLILTTDLSSYNASRRLELEFSYMHHGESEHNNDKVWVRGDTTQAWVEIYNLYFNQSTTGKYKRVKGLDIDGILANALPSQTVGTTFQVRFGQEGTSSAITTSYSDGYSFDGIGIREVLCQSSDNLIVNAVWPDSASVSWKAGEGSIWSLEWETPPPFIPGIGLGADSATTNDTAYTIRGLNQNSTYELYVRDSCTTIGAFSAWSEPLSFLTGCLTNKPSTLPFKEGFEAYPDTFYVSQVNLCDSADYYWSYENSISGQGRLRFSPGTTFPQTGARVATMDRIPFGDVNTNYLTLTINLSNYVDSILRLTFSYSHHGEQNHKNDKVWMRGSLVDPWVQVYDLFDNQSTSSGSYKTVKMTLSPLLMAAGQKVSASTQIRFGQEGTSSATSTSYSDGYSFDDISIAVVPCLEPSSFAFNIVDTTSVEFSWSSSAMNKLLEWGSPGFIPGSNSGIDSIKVPINSHTISALAVNTRYDIYLRNECGTSVSEWVRLSFQTPCKEAISGIYVLGGTPGPNNFPSFDSLATMLNNCGIKGPVNINVASGTYTEHFELGNIAGVSQSNTIVIDGGDSSLARLTHSGSATVAFDSTSYVSLRNITLENTKSSTDAWVVHLQNTDHIVIDSCLIEQPVNTTFDRGGIVGSGSLTSASTITTNKHLTVSDNIITGGYYGISLEGNTSDEDVGNHILRNLFSDIYQAAIQLDKQDSLIISGNVIENTNSSFGYNIYCLNIMDFEITANNLLDCGDEGIIISGGGSSGTTRSLIANNMIYAPDAAIRMTGDNSNVNIYHNTAVGDPAIQFTGSNHSDMSLYNNIFSNPSGVVLDASSSLPSTIDIDYNLYQASGDIAKEDFTTTFTDLADWQRAKPALNAHSIEGDPLFVRATSPADLHVLDSLANDTGKSALGIRFDIDDDPRPLPPTTRVDMGADEYHPATCLPSFGLSVSITSPSTAVLSWTARDTSNWNMEYGIQGFTRGRGTFRYNVSNPYTLSGLTPFSFYDFYIQDSCGAGDVSLWSGPFTFQTPCVDALRGIYTLNGSAAGSNNFSSFDSLATFLSNCGVSGPVIIKVAPGTYREQFTLGDIAGVSSTNTIVIDGGNSLLVTLTHDGSTSNATVAFDSTSYVSLRNMTLENTKSSTDAWVVHLQNTDHIVIDSCLIEQPVNTTSDRVGIVGSGSLDNTYTVTTNKYLTVSDNIITGGYYGISLEGNTSDEDVGNHILRNRFIDIHYYGILVDEQDSLIISGNVIENTNNSFSSGIYCQDITDFEIRANNLLDCGDEGIVIYGGSSSGTARSLIANNMIYAPDAAIKMSSGFSSSFLSKINIYHNTAVGDPAMEFTGSNNSDMSLYNNIFSNPSGVALEASSNLSPTIDIDYNLYQASGNIAEDGSASYSNLATWQRAKPVFNAHSIEGDPVFVRETAPADLHVLDSLANDTGKSNLGIRVDIDNDPRPLPPSTRVDIGADEYHPVTCLSLFGLSASTTSPSTGVLSWTARGTSNWNVEYGIQGFTRGSGAFRHNVSNPYTLSGLTPLSFYDFYVQDSCGAGDVSLWSGPFTFQTPCLDTLSGTYTLGGTIGPNNISDFAYLFLSLNSCGIKGPVTVEVAPGIYTGHLALGNIAGVSQSNTIVIDGGSSSLVRLTHDGSTSNATVSFDGTSYVSLRNMTLENTKSSTDAWVVHLQNTDHIVIDSCLIEQPVNITYDRGGIVGSGSLDNTYTVTTNKYLTVSDNIITGGYYGIALEGNTNDEDVGNYILRNRFIDIYNSGIVVDEQDSLIISGNVIENTNSSFGYDIYCQDITDFEIRANNLLDCGDEGIVIYGGSSSGTARSLIANNMIYAPDAAIKMTGNNSNVNIYHNTAMGLPAMEFIGSNHSNMSLYNNIFSNPNGVALDASVSLPSTIDIDYNLYQYQLSGDIAEDGSTTTFTDLADWQRAKPALNAHSIEGDPVFVRETAPADLHVLDSLANDTGKSALSIHVDIDDEPRPLPPSTRVDIGADEYHPATCFPSIELSALITNVSTAILSWTAQGALNWNLKYGLQGFTPGMGTFQHNVPNPHTLTGLNPGDSYDFYVQDSCGVGDVSLWIGPFTFQTPCVDALKGTYILGGAVGPNNFPDFDSLATLLNNCGVSGAVIINVAPGTYREQFTLANIVGVNQSNTIVIDGGNSSLVTLVHGSLTSNATVSFDGTSYVSLRNITLENTKSSTDAWVVHLQNTDHIVIDSCLIEQPVNTTFDRGGIVGSGSLDNTYTVTTNKHLTVSDNIITGGYYGISLEGNTSDEDVGNYILRNRFIDIYNYGILVDEQDSLIISGNVIENTNSSFGYGIYCEDITDFEIRANNLLDCGDEGIVIYGGSSSGTARSLIANNMIYAPDAAIRMSSGFSFSFLSKINIYHNTAVGDPAMEFTGSNNSDMSFYNNIFSNPNGVALDASVSLPSTIDIDYNLYQYQLSGDIAEDGSTTTFTDLADWQRAKPVLNAHSIEGDPVFVRETAPADLHVLDSLANDTGKSNLGIRVDIDNDPRPLPPSTRVDIGADEYNLPRCLLSPTNLSASITGSTTAVLSWTIRGASNWNVRWDTAGFTPGMGNFVYNTSRPYTLTGLNPGDSYDFYVQDSCWVHDVSAWSGPYSFRMPIILSCPAPTGLGASISAFTTAILSWTTGGASNWNVEWDTAGFTPGMGNFVYTATNPQTLTGLNPGNHEFYVRDSCGVGNVSSWSGPYSFRISVCPGPFNLAYSVVTPTSASISWTAGGAPNWNLEYGSQGFTPGTGTFVYDVPNPYILGNLASGGNYDVYVQDSCAAGKISSWSDTLKIRGFHVDELLEHSLRIYPNPSDGIFNLEFSSSLGEDMEIRIINMLGQVILEDELKSFRGSYRKRLDMATYGSGIYLLQLITEKATVNRRITLQ